MKIDFKKYKIFVFLSGLFFSACAQTPPENKPVSEDAAFEKELSRWIDYDVPLMSCEELFKTEEPIYILDTRKKEEYKISHIKDARYVGYHDFKMEKVVDIPKDAKVVLYCSIGYRSGKVAKKMQRKGYTNIFNLYGSIFEWKNKGYPVINESGNETERVHTYNKKWSKWLKQGEKIY